MTACRICGRPAAGRPFLVPEVQARTGERFPYVECATCGTVQIETIPDDLARHYPPDYYAFSPRTGDDEGAGLRAFLLRAWIRRHVFGRGALGRLLDLRWRTPPAFTMWFSRAGVRPRDPIFDAGCGDGSLLRRMRRLGFRRLAGADPHLPVGAALRGVELTRGPIEAVEGKFRLVMMHHSLEHVPDPLGALHAARARLREPDGVLLVRIPVVAAAFAAYREHWAQLDAPRHLHLFTPLGFHRFAARAGLSVIEEWDDSTEFQTVGSEQAKAGVPLREPPPFPPAERAALAARAAAWRARGEGDSRVFLLAPVSVARPAR